MIGYLRELAQYSHLILGFAQRDIRARYKQTLLGAMWAVLQPFSLMIVFTLVFGTFARVDTDGIPYPIFTYSALIFWSFFASCLNQGTVAMTANAALVRKIYFPRETLLIAVILSSALDLGVAVIMLGALMAYYKVAITVNLVWMVPLLATQTVFTLALVCVTSSIHVYYRDIGHALGLGLQLWMLATPVAYPLSLVPPHLQAAYLLNPMASIIDGYRRVLLYGQAPNPTILGGALIASVALLFLAYLGFKRAERTFADVI